MSLAGVAVDAFHRLKAALQARAVPALRGRRITTITIAIAVGLFVVVAGALFVLRATDRGAAPEIALPRAGVSTAPPKVGATGPPSPATTSAATVTVHAAGAVAHSGIYALPNGSRIAALIEAAGGPAADADVDAINLAERLQDGQRVYVPRRGEVVSAATTGTSFPSAPIDLNAATLDQLDGLPGLGPSTAQAILDYRKERGRFRSVDELLEVRGIGASRLAALKKRLRV
jgi:competence protein ComEA